MYTTMIFCVSFGILAGFVLIFFWGLCSACLLLRTLKKVKGTCMFFIFSRGFVLSAQTLL